MALRRMPDSGIQFFDNCSAVQNATIPAAGKVPTDETLILANAITKIDVSSGIMINGIIYMTPGPGTTGVVIRFRRGYGLTGAIDYEPVSYTDGGLAVIPGKPNALPIHGIMAADWMQQPKGGQYTVTVQQVGATAPGRVPYASVAWFNALFWDIE